MHLATVTEKSGVSAIVRTALVFVWDTEENRYLNRKEAGEYLKERVTKEGSTKPFMKEVTQYMSEHPDW